MQSRSSMSCPVFLVLEVLGYFGERSPASSYASKTTGPFGRSVPRYLGIFQVRVICQALRSDGHLSNQCGRGRISAMIYQGPLYCYAIFARPPVTLYLCRPRS